MYEKTEKSISWGKSQSVIAQLKKYAEYAWLKEVNSQSLQYSHACLKNAFEDFFGKRKGYPKYKKKNYKKSLVKPVERTASTLLTRGK